MSTVWTLNNVCKELGKCAKIHFSYQLSGVFLHWIISTLINSYSYIYHIFSTSLVYDFAKHHRFKPVSFIKQFYFHNSFSTINHSKLNVFVMEIKKSWFTLNHETLCASQYKVKCKKNTCINSKMTVVIWQSWFKRRCVAYSFWYWMND